MSSIIPIIMLTITLIGGGGYLIYTKISKKPPAITINQEQKTANEFVNVKDIKGKFLYTRDGMILCYLKMSPISIDLFSKTEKNTIIKQLTANMSSIQYSFKFIAVSRPVDITPLIAELSELLITSDPKQKELLKQEILEMSSFALSGDVVERQFYVVIWDKAEEGAEKDLLMKAKEFTSLFMDNGIVCDILEQQDIVRLCNLINNPAYMHLEDADYGPSLPILNGGAVL